jgi:hypothetical protein
MKRLIAVTVGLIIAAADLAPPTSAQPTAPPPPAAPLTEPVVASSPAPEWFVWRAFHDSLAFYARQAPDDVADLLKHRMAFDEAQQARFMTAGHNYVQRIEAIDKQARASMFSRYAQQLIPQGIPLSAAKPESLMRADAGGQVRPLLSGTAPDLSSNNGRDGQSVRAWLEANGFIAEVEAQKRVALGEHLDGLGQSFGTEALSKLEAWIAVDVAPNVGMETREFRVPPVLTGAPEQ